MPFWVKYKLAQVQIKIVKTTCPHCGAQETEDHGTYYYCRICYREWPKNA